MPIPIDIQNLVRFLSSNMSLISHGIRVTVDGQSPKKVDITRKLAINDCKNLS